MKSAILRSSIVAATLTFGVFSAPQAHAGAKEIAAINAKLASTNIATSTWDQVAAAVIAAIKDPANKKLKPAVILGEALKSNPLPGTSPSLGQALGVAIRANKETNSLPLTVINPAKPTVFSSFLGTAAVTAATSTGATTLNLADFAEVLSTGTGTAQQAEIFAAASYATKSKSAVGQLIAGYSSKLAGTATTQAALANAALLNSKLAPSSKEIAFGIASNVTPGVGDDFAFTVATADVKQKNLVNIAIGSSAARGDEGADIVGKLFADATYSSATKKVTGSPVALATVKNAAKLATGVSLVADTENVTLQAGVFGKKIETGVLKTSTVSTLAKSLIAGITSRPTSQRNTGTSASVLSTVVNGRTNRADEIGEVAAVLVGSLLKTAQFTTNNSSLSASKQAAAAKSAVTTLVNYIKTIYAAAGSKFYNDLTGKVGTDKSNFKNEVIADVVGSVILTLRQSAIGAGDAAFRTALLNAFGGDATATAATVVKILGKTLAASATGTDVTAALTGVNGAGGGTYKGKAVEVAFEDGTLDYTLPANLSFITDPETDSRGI